MSNTAKTPVIIYLLVIGALLSALVGLFLAFSPLRMFGLIPLVLALAAGALAVLIQHVKKRKLLWPLMVVALSVFGLSYAITSQMVAKPTVAKDEKFEQELKKSAEEGTDELDDLFDEME